MRTDGAIITNAGRELLAFALLNNTEINFTKFKLGKGELNSTDEAKNLRDIISFYKDNPIGFKERINDSEIMINTSFTNESFPEEVQLKEVGLFATTTGKEEVLFAYINDGVGEIYPAGASGNILERVREVHIGITSDAKVEITIDKSLVFVTVYDLEREFNKCALKTTRLVPGNGIQIQENDTLANDINIQIKVSDASIIFDVNKNLTLKKSNTWLNDATTLFTVKGALNLFNELTGRISTGISDCKRILRAEMITIKNNLTSLINTKENSFGKNNAFNKNFGTLTGTVLEGAKLAETLGLEYGGIVNNNSAKVAGKAYYCTANKAIYKCIQNTSLNYIDANYFEGLSNDKLLGKLQNLYNNHIDSKRIFLGRNENPQSNHQEGYIEIHTGILFKSSTFFSLEVFCYHYGMNKNFNLFLSAYCYGGTPTALCGSKVGEITPDVKLYKDANGLVIIRIYLKNTYYASTEVFMKAHMNVNLQSVISNRSVLTINGTMPTGAYDTFIF